MHTDQDCFDYHDHDHDKYDKRCHRKRGIALLFIYRDAGYNGNNDHACKEDEVEGGVRQGKTRWRQEGGKIGPVPDGIISVIHNDRHN